MGNYYFLMCLLPPMPENLGEEVAADLATITDIVKGNIYPEDVELLQAHLGGVDALNWEQMEQGRAVFFPGGALSHSDMTAKRGLPPFIRSFREEQGRGVRQAYPYDRLWELYYEYALGVAVRRGCRFASDYLAWEIGLRCKLLESCVREAGGNVDEHAVLPAFSSGDFSSLIAKLKAQPHPLEMERCLDEERLRQIYLYEGVSGFSTDALMAYLSRAVIYTRWERIGGYFDAKTYLFSGGSS